MKTGGNIVVDSLAAAGVTAVFAVHGVQIDPIFQACADTSGTSAPVALVDVRHEASAGFAAEAYARVNSTVGAVAVCPGPGFTNVLTSIANARVDRTPVVYVVGSTPATTQETNGLQVGLDHVAIVAPVAKWACRVATGANLGRIVVQAIRIATTAPRGPVLLDIPADILATAAVENIAGAQAVSTIWAGIGADDVQHCLDLLAAAERPVLAIGYSPTRAGRAAVVAFVARTGIPCFAEYGAIGTLADDDSAYGGTLYQLGRLPADTRPDVVLAIGVRFGFDTPGLRDGGVGWGTKVLHIDSDPAEIGRFAPPAHGIVADPDRALDALATAAAGRSWNVTTTWPDAVRDARAQTRSELDDIAPTDGERLHPYAAARAVSDAAAASDAVLIGDGAVCKHWLHDALRLPLGAIYLTHGRFGCMGTGFGMAVGAAFAAPGRPVLCATGDGAAGFAIGEFETMIRHQLPVTVVVFNNARWGASQGFQLRPDGPKRIVGTTLSDAGYHDVMKAFGGRGVRVNTIDALHAELADALARPTPTCINVNTNSVGLAPEIPQLNS